MIEVINLASTNHSAVIADVHKLFPEWDEQNIMLHLDENYNPLPFIQDEEGNNVQSGRGYRVDIRRIADRDGEYRVDIIPSVGIELPEFDTSVFPENPDMEYQ